MRPARPAAFTLIELLTVIGIIAVLVAIILPATARVRRQMVITNCMSNQRQLLLATTMFASANRGQIPIPAKPANFGIGGWEPLLSVYLSDLSPTSETLVSKNPVGFGILFSLGYVRDARVFFESNHRNTQASYDRYNRPAGFGAAPGDLVRSAYYCNPHAITSLTRLRVLPEINTRYGITPTCAPFTYAGRHPPAPFDVLIMDRTSLGDSRQNHGYAWNLGYADGSVRTERSSEAVALISNFNGTASTAVWANWALHEAFLSKLVRN